MGTEDTLETGNKFMIGVQGESLIPMMPLPRKLSKADALNLAAWLVALADEDDQFAALLERVKNT